MIAMIACMSKNHVIGKDNQMPWHLPEDLKHLKATTMGKPIVMGRRTFESIGRPLPGRENIILTSDQTFQPQGCTVLHTKEGVLQLKEEKEIIIFGGAQLYEQFFPYAERLYITRIDEDFEGDTFFPAYDEADWVLVSKEKGPKNEKNPYDYYFLVYDRK